MHLNLEIKPTAKQNLKELKVQEIKSNKEQLTSFCNWQIIKRLQKMIFNNLLQMKESLIIVKHYGMQTNLNQLMIKFKRMI